LWEALSPWVRKEGMKLTIDSEDEVEKVRLTLGASIKSLFLRSQLEYHHPPTPKSRGKGIWNSGWTLVNNKDDGEVESTLPSRRKTGRDVEDPGAFKVETQILSDYDKSSDDEVRILIQESDEAPYSTAKTNESVKKLFTLPETTAKSQQQERMECDPLLSQEEAKEPQQSILPQLSSILNGPIAEKDRVCNSLETLPLNEKSVSPPKPKCTIDATVASDADEAESRSADIKRQVEMTQQTRAVVKQTQDKSSVDEDGVQLNRALSMGNREVAMKEPENIVSSLT